MATIAVTQAVTTLRQAHRLFNLVRETDATFFEEWQGALPALTAAEISQLEHLQDRYLRYLEEGEISEGTANIIIISPFLNALGLCDPPYRIRGEQWMQLALDVDTETGPTVLEGRIDALILQEQFWLVVVEGKRGGFNVLQAVPQALAYMMATPETAHPVYGLVTNGYDYLFIKLVKGERSLYALSHNFTLLADAQHNLLQVARIMKRLIDVG